MTVYILQNENAEMLLPFMSEQRLQSIAKIKNESVKAEKICSYALLRYALFREYSLCAAPIFTYGEKGKPYLSDYPHIFFSISHAGGFSACAVFDKEIGIDIQDKRPLKADISHKICTEKEFKELSINENLSEEVCRLWCMKESVGKLTGRGFAEGFRSIETSELSENGRLKIITTENNMFLSVCGYDKFPEIVPVFVTADDISAALS